MLTRYKFLRTLRSKIEKYLTILNKNFKLQTKFTVFFLRINKLKFFSYLKTLEEDTSVGTPKLGLLRILSKENTRIFFKRLWQMQKKNGKGSQKLFFDEQFLEGYFVFRVLIVPFNRSFFGDGKMRRLWPYILLKSC